MIGRTFIAPGGGHQGRWVWQVTTKPLLDENRRKFVRAKAVTRVQYKHGGAINPNEKVPSDRVFFLPLPN